MKVFLYDGTFEGLLTTIFYAYPLKDSVHIERESSYIENMLDITNRIDTENDKSERVYKSILTKLNNLTLTNVYLNYISEIQNSEDLILKYLKLCYKYGRSINLAKNNDTIILIDKYAKKVTNEAHIMKGFVRFKQISNLSFYSKISPDHDILSLIVDHFVARFSDQNFIIHDTKREKAIIYNRSNSIIADMPKEQSKIFNQMHDDSEFETLFKIFYKSLNIEERTSLKSQSSKLPKRYKINMTEFI